MKKRPLAGGAVRLSVARGVYRLSGGSFFNAISSSMAQTKTAENAEHAEDFCILGELGELGGLGG